MSIKRRKFISLIRNPDMYWLRNGCLILPCFLLIELFITHITHNVWVFFCMFSIFSDTIIDAFQKYWFLVLTKEAQGSSNKGGEETVYRSGVTYCDVQSALAWLLFNKNKSSCHKTGMKVKRIYCKSPTQISCLWWAQYVISPGASAKGIR